MEIIVNQEKQVVPDNSSISSLLQEMDLTEKAGFAVALNQQVVTKNKWDSTILKEGDKVLLIEISQGG